MRIPATAAAALALAASLPALAGCAHSHANEEVFTAEQIILVDEDGNRRGGLVLTERGAASLFLAGEDGTPKATVSVTKGGRPSIHLVGADGKTRVLIELDAAGEAKVALTDAEGNVKAALPAGD